MLKKMFVFYLIFNFLIIVINCKSTSTQVIRVMINFEINTIELDERHPGPRDKPLLLPARGAGGADDGVRVPGDPELWS